MFYSVQGDLVAAIAPETHAKDEYCCSSSVRYNIANICIFAIFLTSGIFLQLILTAETGYLILRLATDQHLPWPPKNSIESLSRRTLDQERLLHDQFSFLHFPYTTYGFCRRVGALSYW